MGRPRPTRCSGLRTPPSTAVDTELLGGLARSSALWRWRSWWSAAMARSSARCTPLSVHSANVLSHRTIVRSAVCSAGARILERSNSGQARSSNEVATAGLGQARPARTDIESPLGEAALTVTGVLATEPRTDLKPSYRSGVFDGGISGWTSRTIRFERPHDDAASCRKLTGQSVENKRCPRRSSVRLSARTALGRRSA